MSYIWFLVDGQFHQDHIVMLRLHLASLKDAADLGNNNISAVCSWDFQIYQQLKFLMKQHLSRYDEQVFVKFYFTFQYTQQLINNYNHSHV